ncbi:MAG: MarR family transcriptional regulator [Myxococcota bacterium]
MTTDPDYRALAQLRFEIRRFLAFSEEAAHGAGVEPRQHQLLLQLRGLPVGLRPNIRTVSERLHIKHHSAVELVARAEAAGLILRTRSPEDGREVLLALTPRGEAVLEGLTRSHRDELRTRGPRLIDALGTLLAEEGR